MLLYYIYHRFGGGGGGGQKVDVALRTVSHAFHFFQAFHFTFQLSVVWSGQVSFFHATFG